MQPYSGPAIFDGIRLHRLSELIPPDSGWIITLAIDLNDRNQVAGTAITPFKEHHAVLLNPVPEPTWFLLAVVRHRRHRPGPEPLDGSGRNMDVTAVIDPIRRFEPSRGKEGHVSSSNSPPARLVLRGPRREVVAVCRSGHGCVA